MKKFLLALLLIITYANTVWAQNANRSGFFIETAFGGIVGKTPQVAFSVDNYVLKAHALKGTSLSLTPGFRFKISNSFAYDIALEVQAPLSAIDSQPSAKLLPVGFRYTSSEFHQNYSIYGTLRLGGVVGFQGDGNLQQITAPDMPKQDITIHSDCEVAEGVAASVGVGVNITTSFYAGITYDAQYFFNQYRGFEKTNCLWGMVGLRIGYRF